MALKINHTVSNDEKHNRSQRLLSLSDKKTRMFYQKYVGKTMKVLMEHTKKEDFMYGFTENYIKVELPANNDLDNTVIEVKLGGFNLDQTALKGTM